MLRRRCKGQIASHKYTAFVEAAHAYGQEAAAIYLGLWWVLS